MPLNYITVRDDPLGTQARMDFLQVGENDRAYLLHIHAPKKLKPAIVIMITIKPKDVIIT